MFRRYATSKIETAADLFEVGPWGAGARPWRAWPQSRRSSSPLAPAARRPPSQVSDSDGTLGPSAGAPGPS